jgi:hypothetical protein
MVVCKDCKKQLGNTNSDEFKGFFAFHIGEKVFEFEDGYRCKECTKKARDQKIKEWNKKIKANNDQYPCEECDLTDDTSCIIYWDETEEKVFGPMEKNTCYKIGCRFFKLANDLETDEEKLFRELSKTDDFDLFETISELDLPDPQELTEKEEREMEKAYNKKITCRECKREFIAGEIGRIDVCFECAEEKYYDSLAEKDYPYN